MDEQSLFFAALDCTTDEARSQLLAEVCRGNDSLRRRVEDLLQKHKQAGSFLEGPAVPTAAITSPSALRVLRKRFGGPGEIPSVLLSGDATDSVLIPESTEMPTESAGGRYQFYGEIARGGMGVILQGRDQDLGRELAVKLLLSSKRDNSECVRRFVEEAQINGQLQHPGIVPVYDFGALDDDRPYFAMKLVQGNTLAAMIRKTHHTDRETSHLIDIFEHVCQTMAYVHSRHVIHRDLKPSNIMVGAFGEVQVMDWGLAKVLSTGGIADDQRSVTEEKTPPTVRTLRSDPSVTVDSLDFDDSDTRHGSVMGTYAYMPPEQALGQVDRLDERGDVFSLGAILCEILTGKPPYIASSPREIYRMACRADLDECRRRLRESDAPKLLIELALHCLSVDRQDRLNDASEVADRIARYRRSVQERLRTAELERVASDTRAIEERRRRKLSWLVTALLLVLVVAACVGANRYREVATRANGAESDARNHLQRSLISQFAAESRAIADENPIAAAIMAVNAVEQSDFEDEDAFPLAHMALLNATHHLARLGKPLKADRASVDQTGFAGKHLIALCDGEIRTWDYRSADAFATRDVLSDPDGRIDRFYASDDGRWLVTIGQQSRVWDLMQHGPSRVLFATAATRLTMNDNGSRVVAFAPDASSTHDILFWCDLTRPDLAPQVLAEMPLGDKHDLAVSQDGSWALSTEQERVFVWNVADPSGTSGSTTTPDFQFSLPEKVRAVYLSPDGRWLITVNDVPDNAYKRNVGVWDFEAKNFSTPVAYHTSSKNTQAFFSADSRWLYTLNHHDPSVQRWDLWQNAVFDQSFPMQNSEAFMLKASMSADSERLLCSTCTGWATFWDFEQAASTAVRTYALGIVESTMDPMGRWIASDFRDGAIYLKDLQAVGDQALELRHKPGIAYAPVAVSQTGRWLATINHDHELQLYDTLASTPERLLTLLPDVTELVGFTRDEQFLVACREDKTVSIWNLQSTDIEATRRDVGYGPAALSGDGRCLITADRESGDVLLHDLHGNDPCAVAHRLQGHTGPIVRMCANGDTGRWLVTNGAEQVGHSLRLWDLTRPDQPGTTLSQDDSLGHDMATMTISADGRWFAATVGSNVAIWDLESDNVAQPKRIVDGHPTAIWRLELSRDGRWLFTSRTDATAQLWELSTATTRRIDIPTPGVQGSAISPDGRWLAMCKQGPTMQFFDLLADEPENSGRFFYCPTDTMWNVAISGDSRWLVSASSDGTLRRWSLDIHWALDFARRMTRRQLYPEELRWHRVAD